MGLVVRADHADRDERHPGRRRRPRLGLFNTSQQIGGAVGLALLSTFATNKTSDALASYGRAPTKAEQSQALVDGFHVAWLGSALLLGLAAVLLFVLLRRRDVVAVAEGQIAPVAA